MGAPKGHLSLAAVKKATVWGTPVVAAAGDGLEVLTVDDTPSVDLIKRDTIAGQPIDYQGYAGNQVYAGTIKAPLRYEGCERLDALVLGTAGTPSTVDVSAKKHALRIKNDVAGIFATVALWEKAAAAERVREYSTAKLRSLTHTLKVGGMAEGEWAFAAHALAHNVAAGTNNNTTFASVTLPSNRDIAIFRQLVVRVNATGAGALAAGDKLLYVDEVMVKVERQMKTDHFTTEYGDKISEPQETGKVKVSGRISFSQLIDGTGGSYQSYLDGLSKASNKMDITLTGDSLAGSTTQYFQRVWQLPSVQFSGAYKPIGQAGIAPYAIDFEAWMVTAAPTGMTGITQPSLDIYNQNATDPLA